MNKATSSQTWSLFLSTGVDSRNCDLSKEDATKIIGISIKDPVGAQQILISKGGELKNPKNLTAALRRIEKLGVSFKQKENSMKKNKIFCNHKRNKKVRNKILSRINEIIQEIESNYSNSQSMFEKVAEILNKEGYRCCDGSEWQYKSAYDFHRRNKKKTKKGVSVSMNEVRSTSEACLDKQSLLKTIIDSNIQTSLKIELIKKVCS